MKLTMQRYLEAVAADRMTAAGALIAEGHHHKVVIAKAEKAASKGYTDYGTSCWYAWIEPKGEAFLRGGF